VRVGDYLIQLAETFQIAAVQQALPHKMLELQQATARVAASTVMLMQATKKSPASRFQPSKFSGRRPLKQVPSPL